MKAIDNGIYRKYIVNPDETIDGSKTLIDDIKEDFERFNTEKRIVTSVNLEVHYLTPVVSGRYSVMHDTINKALYQSVLALEESESRIGNETALAFKDQRDSLREKIIRYMDMIVAVGTMRPDRFQRFKDTIFFIHDVFVMNRISNADSTVEDVMKIMHLDEYEIKHIAPTTACPDEFYRVVKVKKTPSNMNNVSNTDEIAKKIDTFIRKWFGKENRIFDKDRDEFYQEFYQMYNSAKSEGNKDVIKVVRSKRVIGMTPTINYGDINKILQQHGLPYTITYKQEPVQGDGKYRPALALKEQ